MPIGGSVEDDLPTGPATAPAADGRLDGLRVLVVDDQPDSRELLATLLEQCGARVLQCETAAAALDCLSRPSADLLIADIAMPDMDGYELIRQVRARGQQVPAIAVTAYARPDDRRQALAAGYSGYCAKPIDGALLVETARALTRAC